MKPQITDEEADKILKHVPEPEESTIEELEPNEYIRNYDELEATKQMLYEERQRNRSLTDDIRKLRGKEPITQNSTKEEEEDEITEKRMKLEYLNDTKGLIDEAQEENKVFLYDEGRIEEFINHWDQLKRVFREMVEIALDKAEENHKKMSIQQAIYDVLYYLEGHRIRDLDRGSAAAKTLKLPEGLTRYISEYFIDQNTETYLRIKFSTPRVNDETLGFTEWRKELAKTPKQRKQDKELFLEESRKRNIEMIKRLNEEKSDDDDEEKPQEQDQIKVKSTTIDVADQVMDTLKKN